MLISLKEIKPHSNNGIRCAPVSFRDSDARVQSSSYSDKSNLKILR